MNGYKNLIVWQKSNDLALEIHAITKGLSQKHHSSLVNKLRRASFSISSKIEDGYEHANSDVFITSLKIAMEHIKDLEILILDLVKNNIIKEKLYHALTKKVANIARLLSTLMNNVSTYDIELLCA